MSRLNKTKSERIVANIMNDTYHGVGNIEVMGIDPRCLSTKKLKAPHPLPFVSRRALKRVRDRLAIPKFCNCCGGPVRLISNMEIYNGTEYGDWPYAYRCENCEAYVGLHPKTDLPLGTLADHATREARKQKKLFISIIKSHFKGRSDAAYQWLSDSMGIEKRMCHWGIFTIEQCNQAATIIERFISETRRSM